MRILTCVVHTEEGEHPVLNRVLINQEASNCALTAKSGAGKKEEFDPPPPPLIETAIHGH